MFVAVILNLSSTARLKNKQLDPQPQASYTSKDKAAAIKKALVQLNSFRQSYPGYQYRLFVGELTEEADTPQNYTLKSVNIEEIG